MIDLKSILSHSAEVVTRRTGNEYVLVPIANNIADIVNGNVSADATEIKDFSFVADTVDVIDAADGVDAAEVKRCFLYHCC